MTGSLVPNFRRPAVCVSRVVKTYGRGGTAMRVLDGVDLLVERGASVFLAGPSGSGKSTLLSILGCILSADEGCVEILGHDLMTLAACQRSVLRRDRIGFVFQRFHLIRGLTACENVGVPLVLRGMPSSKVRPRALDLLQTVDLAARANTHIKNLSAGQCQRVALARALANDPELILADEPTAALDATNGHEMMELLWRLTKEAGRTAVVVTHDPRIFCFADRVYWLENGRVVEQQEPGIGGQRLPKGAAPFAMPPLPGDSSSLIETVG